MSGASSTDFGPIMAVPRFFVSANDKSGTDSDSESVTHGHGGYMSRAMSILSNEDNASMDSPFSPRVHDSSGQRPQVGRGDASQLSACNSALLDLINRLHQLRNDDAAAERQARERSAAHRIPSWDQSGEVSMSASSLSMGGMSSVDFSTLFSGTLLSSSPNSPAILSVLASSPNTNRSGFEAAGAALLRPRRSAAGSMTPLRSHGGDRAISVSCRAASPIVAGGRNKSPNQIQRPVRGSWGTPEASPQRIREESESAATISAGRGRNMSNIGTRAESHELQRSNTPPLMALARTLSEPLWGDARAGPNTPISILEDKAVQQPVESSGTSAPQSSAMSVFLQRRSPKYGPSKSSGGRVLTPDKLDLLVGPISPNHSGGGSSKRRTAVSPMDGSGNLDLGTDRSILLASLKKQQQKNSQPRSFSSTPRENDNSFKRRSSRELPSHRVDGSSSWDRGQITGTSSADSTSTTSPFSSRQDRYGLLPENRRMSIEKRARSSGDYVRSEYDGAAGALGEASSGADRRRSIMTSEQKTELVALEVLQDVASSSMSSETSRQLEYLLESLGPIAETALSLRTMDVVEALGTIIRRKLNLMRDMESVCIFLCHT